MKAKYPREEDPWSELELAPVCCSESLLFSADLSAMHEPIEKTETGFSGRTHDPTRLLVLKYRWTALLLFTRGMQGSAAS